MSTPLCTPADMFANIPGVLGFYPEQSIVFAGFQRVQHTGKFVLGPMVRIDTFDLGGAAEVLETLNTFGVDLIFAYIIDPEVYSGHTGTNRPGSGYAPDDAAYRYVVDVYREAKRLHAPLQAMWATAALFTGENYVQVFGLSRDELGPTTSGRSTWERGQIACVAQAASTQGMLEGGLLPELHRDDTMRFFDPVVVFEDAMEARCVQNNIMDTATRVEKLAEERSPDGAATFAAVLDELWDVLAMVRAKLEADLAIADDHELLTSGAVFFANQLLRDVALIAADKAIDEVVAPNTHKAYMELALTVARVFDGELRANALCVYALAASCSGQRVRALPAVRCALETVPNHGLGRLLLRGFYGGLFEPLLHTCVDGSERLRKYYSTPRYWPEPSAGAA